MTDEDEVTKASTRGIAEQAAAARNFPVNTCPASRHVEIMAETLAEGKRYAMLEEEPIHCAGSLYSVLNSLWRLRTKKNSLKFQVAQLRHAYMQLAAGTVKDQKQFADGLIAPAIRRLEELLDDQDRDKSS